MVGVAGFELATPCYDESAFLQALDRAQRPRNAASWRRLDASISVVRTQGMQQPLERLV
jgi:hypothetical protein